MPHLEFRYQGRCNLCGYRLRGFLMASFVINKRSLRSRHPALSYVEKNCPECGFEAAGYDLSPWRLTPDSENVVAAARAHRTVKAA